jgi:high frequency lysogenization protein
MNPKLKHQTLALAGVLQAAELVNELALHGNYNPLAFKTSIDSLYQLDAKDVESVYNYNVSHQGLLLGLSTLEKLLTQEKSMLKKRSLQYFFNMLHLERKFTKRADLMSKLREIIRKITGYSSFKEDSVNAFIMGDLADAYTAMLSNFNFKIIITGNQHHLSARDNLNKIRALLLAGVRSAVLWRQVGGNRWQLMFGRNKILKAAQELLA